MAAQTERPIKREAEPDKNAIQQTIPYLKYYVYALPFIVSISLDGAHVEQEYKQKSYPSPVILLRGRSTKATIGKLAA